MLDLDLIEDTIQELEQEPTTFDGCEKLASLYICRMMNKRGNMSVLDTSEEYSNNVAHVQAEDILPAYNKYVDTKKRYQQFEVVDKMLIYAMDDLCKEVTEFIADLYHNSETTAERTLIVEMVNNLRNVL